jgi:NAD(P)-dependent dehydrogenase (short-subunit alcohol dehydrogenase family)
MAALQDRVVIVTGGTAGIGEATVDHCASLGARVIFTGRNAARGTEVAARTRSRFIRSDVREKGAAEAIVRDVLSGEGRIDVLVNNAGVLFLGKAEECTDEEWEETIATNVTGVFRMSRAVVPVMRRQGGGAIVNVASDWALVAAQSAVAYGTSKGAIAQLTRSMAVDHACDRIRVNAVCPGDTETEMLMRGATGKAREKIAARHGAAIPLGRMGQPQEVAKLIAFLASDDAAFITGALMAIDGGNSAQ